MKTKVWLTDTTLRDGEQRSGFALNADDKVKLAGLLDAAGYYQIEAGIPAMGRREKDTICRIMELRKNAKIAVWNRMKMEDVAHSCDCRPDVMHLSAPVSDIMISGLLRKDRRWVKKQLADCISYAKDKGYEVSVGFQDASRADIDFLRGLISQISALGVNMVRLADTVGILTPLKARYMAEALARETDIGIAVHTHNDLGMAAAVAAEAVKGGARFVDTTLFGIGERAGNCDAYTFAQLTEGYFDVAPAMVTLEKLMREAKGMLVPKESDSGEEASACR